MHAWIVKASACCVLFALGFGGAILPSRVDSIGRHPVGTAVANAFAAGVFLALALVHMLPEADEALRDAYDGYRVAPAAALLGFLIILLLEMMADDDGGRRGDALPTITVGEEEDEAKATPLARGAVAKGSPSGVRGDRVDIDVGMTHDTGGTGTGECAWMDNAAPATSAGERDVMRDNSSGGGDCDGEEFGAAVLPSNAVSQAVASSMTAWILVGGLSLHSLLEGVTIGLEDTSSGALLLAASIGLHKGVAGVALGVNLSGIEDAHGRGGFTARLLAACALFGAATPVGILVGWVAEADLPATASGFIKAASAGTFVFIGCVELMPVVARQTVGAGSRRVQIYKFVSCVVGMAAVYLMSVFLDFD